MDQDEKPQDLPNPSEGSSSLAGQANSGAGHIDIEKVLLPQKEVRKIESAQRVNAGILFEQGASGRSRRYQAANVGRI